VFQLSENDTDTQVHAKAKSRGMDTFTIVAQDKSAPTTICYWILQNIETAPPDKLHDALKRAIGMRTYSPRKNAD
jgi:hypothetical protein